MLVRKTIKAEAAYLESLESNDMFSNAANLNPGPGNDGKRQQRNNKKNKTTSRAHTPQAAALKGCISALTALHGKLNGDIPFAKRDIAYGKLGAKDIDVGNRVVNLLLLPHILSFGKKKKSGAIRMCRSG